MTEGRGRIDIDSLLIKGIPIVRQNNLNTLMSMLNSEDCDEDFWKKMLPEYEKDKYMPSNHAFMGPKN